MAAMPRATNYYELLGVSPDASAEEIHRAYRRLARRYHPDTGAGAEQHAHFHELSDAYEVLRDPGQRARYDRSRLAVRRGSRSRPSPFFSAGPSRDVPRFLDEQPSAVDRRVSPRPVVRVQFAVRWLR